MNDASRRELSIAFTASGSEYLRIWIVNSLLLVLTLGFYIPFAKVRRLRYFYANTVIDGQPLAFHGDPWKLLRGYVLMLVLFGGYAVVGRFSAWAAVAMFLLLALLWPALWRSSLRFRLHNTSWRGLRFGFEGTTGGAYLAIFPMFVPSLFFVAANAWFLGGSDRSDPNAMEAAMQAQWPYTLAGFALLALLFPLCLWLLKGYQHGGYRYAGQRASFSAPLRAYYKLALQGMGWGLLGMALLLALMLGLLFAVGAWGAGAGADGAATASGGLGVKGTVATFFPLIICVGLIFVLGAWFSARGQNLSWTATQSAALFFESHVRARDLVWLSLKNFLLTVVTLGLYRPFAVVNTVALRLGAVRIAAQEDVAQWRAGPALGTDNASGEMAGDFFGIDLGL